MKRLVEFQTESGQIIVVEVDEPEVRTGPVTRGLGSATTGVVERAKDTFEDALQKAQPVAAALIEQLRALEPDEATVEFGMSLSVQAGAILASGTSNAHYRVTLTWRNNKRQS